MWCKRCGRRLRDADSLARGYGPECAKKEGLLESPSFADTSGTGDLFAVRRYVCTKAMPVGDATVPIGSYWQRDISVTTSVMLCREIDITQFVEITTEDLSLYFQEVSL